MHITDQNDQWILQLKAILLEYYLLSIKKVIIRCNYF